SPRNATSRVPCSTCSARPSLPPTAQPQGVAAHELARDRLVAVVAPGHRLADASEVDMRTLSSEVFVDLPPGTAGRTQSDLAFAAAGLERDVAFEVTSADYIARLVGQDLCIAMLPSLWVPHLSGVVTIEVTDGPTRVEYVVWGRTTRTPAATAFLDILGIPATPSPAART
ncbi:hypothetical protein GV794_27100, partial [Nocardia cyriacigeorgica]